MGFLGEFIGVIRILEGPFTMPVVACLVAFFVMLGGGAMGVSRLFVRFRGLPMGLMHTPGLARGGPLGLCHARRVAPCTAIFVLGQTRRPALR